MEELDIGVEEVTLGDVDAAEAKLVDERENAGGDGGFADGAHGGEGAGGGLVFENDAVEFGDVEVVRGGAGGDVEGEAVAGEDGFSEGEDEGFDLGLDGGEREVGDFAAGGGESEGDVGEGGGFFGGGRWRVFDGGGELF